MLCSIRKSDFSKLAGPSFQAVAVKLLLLLTDNNQSYLIQYFPNNIAACRYSLSTVIE
ncbi:hypothetical protein J6590_089726 [Homalodisca vitripennis]|nr:hypothetical protein J6590_089726 [Homalodisca vitripennis]